MTLHFVSLTGMFRQSEGVFFGQLYGVLLFFNN